MRAAGTYIATPAARAKVAAAGADVTGMMIAASPAKASKVALATGPIVVRATELDIGWSMPDDEDDEDCIPLDDGDLLDVRPLPRPKRPMR